MADARRTPSRAVLGALGALVVVVLLVVLRGPVALLAAATVAVLVGYVLAVPPLLRDDGIDWDWLPDRADEVPPEPGIATLRRLLSPASDSTGSDTTGSDTTGSDTTGSAAPTQLHDLVRAIAEDRSEGRGLGDDLLATYLAGPPRRLDLDEVDTIITALEALPRRSPQ